MPDAKPSPGRKRARLFGRDPLPGFVFSLDTSRKDLIFQPAGAPSEVSAVGWHPSAGVDKPPLTAAATSSANGAATPAPGATTTSSVTVSLDAETPAATVSVQSQDRFSSDAHPSPGVATLCTPKGAATPAVPAFGSGCAEDTIDTAHAPGESAPAAAKGVTSRTPTTPAGGYVSTGAASLVSSFLKGGSTASPSARPNATGASYPHALSSPSTPKTPTPLAFLVAGVPPGSSGSVSAGSRTPVGGAKTRIQSPHKGANRLCHDEWPPSLRKRRRILHLNFPKTNEPIGTRILYWVRGNYRVKDNLGLSVALWLSTKLQLPLQAVTFVDPKIGQSMASRNQRDKERQELPFRMAVETSALCEMEEALRALNVPLVAIACAESEVPSALALWCGGGGNGTGSVRSSQPGASQGGSSASGGVGAVAGTAAITGARAAAAASSLPPEGRVCVTIMDECYHPRQLLLAEKVKDALGGKGALYGVDSSCVYPVNTNGGGAGGAQARSGAVAGNAAKNLSPEEFRQAQDACLPAALADLTPKPRLPLEARLQSRLLASVEERAVLPPQFERSAKSSTGPAVTVLSWSELREASARRFPGFGKPIPRPSAGCTKDLISILGGGERVGEEALRQTLDVAGGSAAEHQRAEGVAAQGESTSLENEAAGAGFGGSLLHLLRLGSVSSLYAVQALLCRPPNAGAGDDEQDPKVGESRRLLLDKVLQREYALYRAHRLHRSRSHRRVVGAAAVIEKSRAPVTRGNEWRGWMGILPAWVWKELNRGQGGVRQHQHSPGEILSAGSSVPSSVHDEIFSAIQARLTTGARLHPSLAPYWARAVVRMMLIPSQAVSLLINMAEDLCLGAAHSGDVVYDLFDGAFGVSREPAPAAAASAYSVAGLPPSPGRSLGTEEGLRSALGGADALARFLSASPAAPSVAAS